MNRQKLQHTINLSRKLGYDFFVTLDGKVSPQIETTEKPSMISGKKLKIKVWVDPDVVDQLLEERRVSLVIIQQDGKRAFRVAGHLDNISKLEQVNETMRQSKNRMYGQQALYEFVIGVESVEEVE